MIRPPPKSPPFPSTPLFRSHRHAKEEDRHERRNLRATARLRRGRRIDSEDRRGTRLRRSEEHTSELQSLAYLVCRLLLEKKNTIIRSGNTAMDRSRECQR